MTTDQETMETTKMDKTSMLEQTKPALARMIEEQQWHNTRVMVIVKPLTAEEAIGNPERTDYPIVEGKERVIEAEVLDAKAHVFTDSPGNFSGKLSEIMDLILDNNQNRAIYVGALNATLKHLGVIKTTLHCRNEEPEKCAGEIASFIQTTYGNITIGLVGLNPAIADGLIRQFGPEHVRITDLNHQNVGKLRNGVIVWDGKTCTGDLVKESDLVLLTGTTVVNGTFDGIWSLIQAYQKEHLVFGVTASGLCELAGLKRICPYGHS